MKLIRKHLYLLLAVLLLLPAGCAGRNGEGDPEALWQEQYDLGEDSLAAGALGKAYNAFMAAIEINPEKLDAYSGLAAVYSAWGDYETAAKILTHQYDAVRGGNLRPPWDDTQRQDGG